MLVHSETNHPQHPGWTFSEIW